LIRPRINFKKDVALMDELAFLEIDFVQITADSRPNFHRFHCCRAAGEVGEVRDFLLDGRADGYDRRRQRGRLFSQTPAAGHYTQQEQRNASVLNPAATSGFQFRHLRRTIACQTTSTKHGRKTFRKRNTISALAEIARGGIQMGVSGQ
jgi:hypothetical protein